MSAEILNENNGSVQFVVHEKVVKEALDNYFKEHLFKETWKVDSIQSSTYGELYTVVCKSVLGRLGGGNDGKP